MDHRERRQGAGVALAFAFPVASGSPAPSQAEKDATRDAADAALVSALNDEENARGDYDGAVATTDQARAAAGASGLSPDEKRTRDAAYDDAKRREKEAKETLDKARERRQKKEDEAARARAASGDSLNPSSPLTDPACQRLLGGGQELGTRLVLDGQSADAAAWLATKRDRVSKPRVDTDPVTSGDAFFLPSCDGGSAVGPSPAVSCDAVAMCRDATTQCGCTSSVQPRDLGAMNAMRALMCTAVMHCADGQHPMTQGQGCGCTSDTPPANKPPRPAPFAFALQKLSAPTAAPTAAGSFTRLATDMMRRDGGRPD